LWSGLFGAAASLGERGLGVMGPNRQSIYSLYYVGIFVNFLTCGYHTSDTTLEGFDD